MSVERATRNFGVSEIPLNVIVREATGKYGQFNVRLYFSHINHDNPEIKEMLAVREVAMPKWEWSVSVWLWLGAESSHDTQDFKTQGDAEDRFNLLVKEYNLAEKKAEIER